MRSLRLRTVAALLALATVAGGLTIAAGTTPAGAVTEPRYHVPKADLRAALHCPTGVDSAGQPVLLVHGTFTHGMENYGWNYLTELPNHGIDACYVNLPNRSLDDIQIASEYVVFAIRKMHRLSGGRRIDILGHSQGGLEPRWALRWWPSLLPMVSDLVTLASPNHGTMLGNFDGASCGACFQMAQTSNFIAALNTVDETPGNVEYTNLATMTDELVQPPATTFTDGAANILLQDVCLGRPVDHLSIVADRLALELVLDAFTHRGPASLSRLPAPAELCTQMPLLFPSDPLAAIAVMQANLDDPRIPDSSIATEEPPLRRYTTR